MRSILAVAFLCLQSACGGNDFDTPIDHAPLQATAMIYARTSSPLPSTRPFTMGESVPPVEMPSPISDYYLDDLHSRSVAVLQYVCYRVAEDFEILFMEPRWEVAFRIPAADLDKVAGIPEYRTKPSSLEGDAIECASRGL